MDQKKYNDVPQGAASEDRTNRKKYSDVPQGAASEVGAQDKEVLKSYAERRRKRMESQGESLEKNQGDSEQSLYSRYSQARSRDKADSDRNRDSLGQNRSNQYRSDRGSFGSAGSSASSDTADRGSFGSVGSSASSVAADRIRHARSNSQRSDQAIKEHIYNYIHDVWMKWHLILLAMVAVAVVADTSFTVMYKPTYTTSASVVIKQNVYEEEVEESLSDVADALGYVISSDVFLDEIKEDLDVDTIPGTYKVSHMDGTNVLKITAQASSPKVSYRMMYYMMKRYKDVMHYVIGDTSMYVLENMQVPETPDNSVDHKRNLFVFGMFGALIMVAFLAMQSAMRDTIKSQDDVRDKLQVRMLADIATESKWYLKGIRPTKKRSLLMTQLSTSFTFVETFKRLGTRFEAEARENNWKVVLINSTWEDEGKTSVVANLAIQLASMNRRILLVDTDFGKPALEKILHIQPEHGLEEALRGEIAFSDIIYHDKVRKMDCVFVNKAISDATSLLEGEEFRKCLDSVKDQYDYILLDTPPASYLGMSLIVAQHADAVLLVTRQNFAPTVLINRIIERYVRQESPVMGVVLNRSMPRIGLSGRSYR